MFVYNFHSDKSYTDYRIGVEEEGEYQVVLSSDDRKYGGWDRVDTTTKFHTTPLAWNNRKNFIQVGDSAQDGAEPLTKASLQVYIPSRVGIVLAKV